MNSTDSPPDAEISVIIVNYGTAALAIDAVESVLAREHGGRTVDIHLLDNASPGADAADLARAHAARNWGARVTLYLEAENHGFGRGNNVVLRALASRKAPPRKVMLLNPDARLENEAVEMQADLLDTHPKTGFVGPSIAKPDGTKVTAAFRFPNAINEFAMALNLGPVARLCRRWMIALPHSHPQGPVDWLAGAAVMARWEALTDVGFFDPAFFLYFEEVDLMRQGASKGWDAWYLPKARVVHAEGAATGVKSMQMNRPRRPAYWYRSWHHYYRKNHGRFGACLAGAAWMAGAGLNCIIAPVTRRRVSAPSFLFRDFWSFSGRPLVGLKPLPHE